MNRALGIGQMAAGSSPTGLHDLGGDRNSRLLRGSSPEVEADRGMKALEFFFRHPCFAQTLEAILMGSARPHSADVAGATCKCDLQRRDIELGIVSEDRDDGALINLLLLKPAVRPVDHNLVSVGESLLRGEDRPGVADGDAIAKYLAHAHQCGREVDGTEHVHLSWWCVAGHEDVEAFTEALAFAPVVKEAGGSRRQHAEDILANGVVEPLGSQRAFGAGGTDDEVTADPLGDLFRSVDDRRDCDRLLGLDARGDALELRPSLVVDPLSEYLDDAAAGETDPEGLVVADAVLLVSRLTVRQNLDSTVEEGSLDAPAADRSDRLLAARDEHGGPGGTGSGLPRPHDGGHGHGLLRPVGGQQFSEHLSHDLQGRPIMVRWLTEIRRFAAWRLVPR